MSELNTPYSYTILRYVHDTLTGEFVNVGVALLAPKERFAGALCRKTYGRLAHAFPGMDGEAFKKMMRFIEGRFEEFGERLSAELPFESPKTITEIAQQILPADDSSLQWSPAGGGLTKDPSSTLEALFKRMVSSYDDQKVKETRTDEDVWRDYKRTLETCHVLQYLKPKKIAVQDDEVEFQHAWKNDRWHCLEPISFDLSLAESIREKAHKWLGQIVSVRKSGEEFNLYLLVGQPQDRGLKGAFEKAMSILEKIPGDKQIIPEEKAAEFSSNFARQVAEHENPTQ